MTLVLTLAFAGTVNAQVGYGGSGGGTSGGRGFITNPTAINAIQTRNPQAGRVLGASTFTFVSPLRRSNTGDAVVELQERLRALGFFKYPVSTGFFGPITLAAVQAFQTANNIPSTGYVGALTIAALNK